MLQNRKKNILERSDAQIHETEIRDTRTKLRHSHTQDPQVCSTGTGAGQSPRKRLACMSGSMSSQAQESTACSSVKKLKVYDIYLNKATNDTDGICNNKRLKPKKDLQNEKDLQLLVSDCKNHEKKTHASRKEMNEYLLSPSSQLKDLKNPLYGKIVSCASEDICPILQDLGDPSDMTSRRSNTENVKRQDGVLSTKVHSGQNKITFSSEVIPPLQKLYENSSDSASFSKPKSCSPKPGAQLNAMQVNGNQSDGQHAQHKDKVLSPETNIHVVRDSNGLDPETKVDAVEAEDDRMSLDEESFCEDQIEIPVEAIPSKYSLTNDSLDSCRKQSKMVQKSITEDHNDQKTLNSTLADCSVSASGSNIPVILGNKTPQSEISYSLPGQHSIVQCPSANPANLQSEVPQAIPEMQSSYVYASGAYYPPYYSWYVCHQSSNNSSLNHTYQEVTFERQQAAPSHKSATITSAQVFNYWDPTKTQGNNFTQPFPGYGHYSGCMPLSYNSSFASNPVTSQALLPYSNPGEFWNWGSWQ
ncbi:uncharacterized protein LOC115091789 isoform X2 [Rhinatrema bivittatum]|uniref:uncharacterized protein LOC115091789 isoform X2 n=1 Tax=Rhinatrema bivittatum TaxID=194408 RepID=UPI00112E38D9|nr:uncharacterized protein LOC115091789 isoform X2 [Rhinatrema bivittatum]